MNSRGQGRHSEKGTNNDGKNGNKARFGERNLPEDKSHYTGCSQINLDTHSLSMSLSLTLSLSGVKHIDWTLMPAMWRAS